MKYSVDDEILCVHFNFFYKDADFSVDVYGDPVDVSLFEKMLDDIGFDRDDY